MGGKGVIGPHVLKLGAVRNQPRPLGLEVGDDLFNILNRLH
jgi:hypothetical protein